MTIQQAYLIDRMSRFYGLFPSQVMNLWREGKITPEAVAFDCAVIRCLQSGK